MQHQPTTVDIQQLLACEDLFSGAAVTQPRCTSFATHSMRATAIARHLSPLDLIRCAGVNKSFRCSLLSTTHLFGSVVFASLICQHVPQEQRHLYSGQLTLPLTPRGSPLHRYALPILPPALSAELCQSFRHAPHMHVINLTLHTIFHTSQTPKFSSHTSRLKSSASSFAVVPLLHLQSLPALDRRLAMKPHVYLAVYDSFPVAFCLNRRRLA